MTVYIDTSAATNGSGTQQYPFNTHVGITAASNETYLFKTGTVIRSTIDRLFEANGVTVAEYGTGEKPIVDLSAELPTTSFDSTNGVYQSTIGSNTFGNITQDGVPMKHISWNTNIATTAALMPAGSFTFDTTNFIVYFKPTSGNASGYTYRYSAGLTGVYGNNRYEKLTFMNFIITGAARHGLQWYNKRKSLVKNVEARIIGGIFEGGKYMGNGFELAAGTHGTSIEECTAVDIFDSAFTSQLFGGGDVCLHDHKYLHNVAKRCGLAGIELSSQGPRKIVRNMEITGFQCEELGNNSTAWGGRPTSPASAIFTGTNSTHGLGQQVTNCFITGVRARRVDRLWSTVDTFGYNAMWDSSVDQAFQYESRRIANNGNATQTDVYANIKAVDSAAIQGNFLVRSKYSRPSFYI